ncbi:MAG: D-2-hydroxyacid dehydrogenase [Caldilineaceae bacterium]
MKVLLASRWVDQFMDELKAEFPDVEFVTADDPLDIAEAEVAFGPVPEEIFVRAESLRWIQSSSAGVEWMRNTPSLLNTDVMVTNTRGAHATTIAEHAFGMLVFLARDFAGLYESQKRHAWEKPARTVGLVGMTMGIIGLGQIGRAIATRAKAFEMDVIAVDLHPVAKPDYVSELRQLDGLDDLMRRADVVVVATPITDETRGMVGEAQLRLMKPDAYLLVMSRGGIIDEPTLIDMLQNGKLAGAGLDVTAIEPLPADNPLWDAPNIIITPHCSPTSDQTRGNVTNMMKTNLRHYLAGEPLENLVDKKLGY